MSLLKLKSSVHGLLNQSYIYNCSDNVNFTSMDDAPVIICNNTNIVSILAIKTFLGDTKITVIGSLDEKVYSLTDQVLSSNIEYVENVSFWDHKSVLLIDKKLISEVEQKTNRFLLFICGPDMPSYAVRKNLTKQVFFDVTALKSMKNINEELDSLSINAWDGYLKLLKGPAEIWFRQSLNATTNKVMSDTTGACLDGYKFNTASILMSKKLQKLTKGEDNVGVCLPTSVGGYLTILSLMISAKSIVNLNYTASEDALNHAIETAGIETIITSRAFVEKLELKGFFLEKIFSKTKIIYLEDVKASISKFDSIKTFLEVKYLSANMLVKKYVKHTNHDNTAFIIYSSGSEGVPKGIVIKNKNILANVYQSTLVVECNEYDSIAVILPIFHGFGLTISLVSLFQGGWIACHPDPTDAKAVAKLIRENKTTVLCATPTFLRLYTKNKSVKKEDFSTLRLIITGAEKLSKEVRIMFEDKFDKVINEGYGTTELSPVAAVNRSRGYAINKIGTVGTVVPGGQFNIIHPETHEELHLGSEGMIIYRGVNRMDGYLNDPKKTNAAMVDIGGYTWYMTGDKGKLDGEGFLTVVDRYSRFAKVAGEMVSFTLLEQEVYELLGDNGYDYRELDFEVLAVATPDAKRGETITMLTTLQEIDTDTLKSMIRKSSIENLYKPSQYFKIESVPKLGSGKTDFSKAKKLTIELLEV